MVWALRRRPASLVRFMAEWEKVAENSSWVMAAAAAGVRAVTAGRGLSSAMTHGAG